MTQDEIIEMARKSGLSVKDPQFGWSDEHHIAGWITTLEIFAKLVAAKEREACAKTLENISNAPDIKAYAAAIRARGEA